MKYKKNIYYGGNDDVLRFKYEAVIFEENDTNTFSSNNLTDLKSFVYNIIKKCTSDAIACICPAFSNYPIYKCCKKAGKTYKCNIK